MFITWIDLFTALISITNVILICLINYLPIQEEIKDINEDVRYG